MTEREKMLSGQLYDPMDNELEADRTRAHELCHQLRMSRPTDRMAIRALCADLFGKPADNIFITPPFFCDYGYNIHFAGNFYCNTDCVILDCAAVHIGSDVLLGPKVQIYTALHPLKAHERADLEYALPVTIGNKVWIGGGAVICANVNIGDGCVIGAGSVVTRDIPPFSLAVGNPCRAIRNLA